MNRFIKKKEGSALVVIVIALAIVSILGLSIILTTTSNYKMTKLDSRSQGAYYIAEAGANKVIHDIGKKVDDLSEETLSHQEFFEKLDKYIEEELNIIINSFEENFGEIPQSEITLFEGEIVKDESTDTYTERVVSYKISSVGKIGHANRTVNTTIEIVHQVRKGGGHHPAFDYVLYNGSNRTFNTAGNAIIDGSIYAHNIILEATNSTINGSIISENSVELRSAVKVNGNIYAMNGTVNLNQSNLDIKGNIYATGNVNVSHGTSVDSIYTDGNVVLSSSGVRVIEDIHANGNISLGSGSIVKNIYTNGNITFTSNNTMNGEVSARGNISLGSSANVKNLFTNGNVEFSSNNTINGNINAKGYIGSSTNGSGVTINGNIFSGNNVITRNNNNFKIFGNVHAVENIENGNNNSISGNVVSAKQVINRGIINGSITQNGIPVQPHPPASPKSPNFEKYENTNNKVPLTTFNIGSTNIINNNNSTTHDILPGSYNDLSLKWNDTVKFTSGNYYFNNINANNSAIKMRLDLSNGPINIFSKGNITFASGLEVYVSQDGINYIRVNDNFITNNRTSAIELAGKVYWEANNFTIAENCYFIGTILANNNLTMGYAPKLVGSYTVNEGTISMGYNPTIIFAPPTESAAANSGGAGGPGGGSSKGKNLILLGERIRTTIPIREM